MWLFRMHAIFLPLHLHIHDSYIQWSHCPAPFLRGCFEIEPWVPCGGWRSPTTAASCARRYVIHLIVTLSFAFSIVLYICPLYSVCVDSISRLCLVVDITITPKTR